MAFNEQGFRQAAQQQGFSQSQIDRAVKKRNAQERTGVSKFLFDDKTSTLGKIGSAVGNVLNIPSYALGGILNRGQEAFGSQYAQGEPGGGIGILEGIANKRAIMTELPETFGIDPNSTAGRVIGFGGELLTPDPVGLAGDIFKAGGKSLGIVGDVGKASSRRGILSRASEGLENMSEGLLTRGLGQPDQLQKLEKIGGGEKTGSFIRRLGLESRDPNTARKIKEDLLKELDDIAIKSNKTTNVSEIVSDFNKKIAKYDQSAKRGSIADGAVRDELERRLSIFLDNIGQSPETGLGNVPLRDVTFAKRAAASDVPRSYIGLAGKAKGQAQGSEVARKIFQEGAIRGDERLRGLGLDLRRLGGNPGTTGYIDVFERAGTRASARQPLSLKGLTSAGVGSVIGGIPGVVGGVAAETIANNPRFLRGVSGGLSATSKAIGNIPNIPSNKVTRAGGRALKSAPLTTFRVSQQPKTNQSQSRKPVSRVQPVVQQKNPSSSYSVPQEFSFNDKLKNNKSLFSRRN